MMFKEIHEQILVRASGAHVLTRADCCFLQLLGSSTPQTVVPLLMGRSSSTAVMRSRYMSRDAGPSTQEQVNFVFYSRFSFFFDVNEQLEHNQDQKQEDGAAQEEGEHAAPLEQRKPAAASDGPSFMF